MRLVVARLHALQTQQAIVTAATAGNVYTSCTLAWNESVLKQCVEPLLRLCF